MIMAKKVAVLAVKTQNVKKMKNFHPTGNCPVRDVISRLGDKWSMLVLIEFQQ